MRPSWCSLSLVIVMWVGGGAVCWGEEAALVLLNMAQNSLSRVKDLQLMPKDTTTQNLPGKNERILTYLDVTKELISQAKKNVPTCAKCRNRPMDCYEVLVNGNNQSGVYSIWPRNRLAAGKPVDVFCDMDTEGGGWTVIQRRSNCSEEQSFYQGWESYKTGFGNITRDFWLGNDLIHALSSQAEYEARFDLQDAEEFRRYAAYKNFWTEAESASYTLHINNYTGNAGDSMKHHDGLRFSTKDKGTGHWARSNVGGWWYDDNFAFANLNGLYKPGVTDIKSVTWFHWRGHVSLAHVEIKIRPSSRVCSG